MPRLRQTTDNAGTIPSAAMVAPSEVHANEDAETPLNNLRRESVGARNSGGGYDNVDAQGEGAGLVNNIRHLLAPSVSLDAVS